MQVVAHNIASQFTNRQLNMTTSKKAKSAEKLSSGYRINRSADDAAGLQISEKMRSQIRGLNQASRNIQDGVSLCQVADGALNETTEVLQRIRELSVQAANDTNQQTDRAAIQEEINQLAEEVDRIATTTNFNSEIYPLKAKEISPVVQSNGMDFTLKESTWSGVYDGFQGGTTFDGVLYNTTGQPITLRGITVGNGKNLLIDKRGNGISTTIRFGRTSVHKADINRSHSLSLKELKTDENGYVYYISKSTGNKMYLAVYDNGDNSFFLNSPKTIRPETLRSSSPNITTFDCKNTLDIQAGSMEGQTIGIDLVDATCSGIGLIVPIDVSSNEKAGQTITNVDEAIKQASAYRSQFGAQQNRLECAKSVDDNAAENTQYAESRIRDTDMAEEMVEYSKSNILEQVGQSMLAQANQSTQGILSLLSQ